MEKLYIDATLYSLILKNTIQEVIEENKLEDKITQPDDLTERWESKTVTMGNKNVKFIYSLNIDKVEPNIINQNNKETEIVRFSPCGNFEAMVEDEVQIFDNLEQPVEYLSIVIFKEINKKQTKELEELLKKQHKAVFKKDIKKVNITYMDITPLEEQIDRAEVEAQMLEPN